MEHHQDNRLAVPAKGVCHHEHPVVVPQVTHFRQVPLRTMVN